MSVNCGNPNCESCFPRPDDTPKWHGCFTPDQVRQMMKEMAIFLKEKTLPKITLDNDCWFYYVDLDGENIYQTEDKYKQAMFAAELKLKIDGVL